MKNLCFIIFFLIATTAFSQQKYALVIGNGNYTHTTKLNNPVNDANDMTTTLQGLGFSVDKILNGNQEQMINAIIRLKNRLSVSKNSYGFLFYAGHGVQSNGENFLIPIDVNIPTENFLRNRTVSVQEMLDELNDAGNELNMVILDACRDNPFSWKRSGSRGLSIVVQQPADSIIVFATTAGSTAADGTGRNGLFTSHLLNNLKTPGLEITEIFRRTGADVARASNNQQRPAVYNQFYGRAYLGNRPTQTVQPNTVPPQQLPQATPVLEDTLKVYDDEPQHYFICKNQRDAERVMTEIVMRQVQLSKISFSKATISNNNLLPKIMDMLVRNNYDYAVHNSDFFSEWGWVWIYKRVGNDLYIGALSNHRLRETGSFY
jgi:hypothetical protein